jgi:hypothetical protein
MHRKEFAFSVHYAWNICSEIIIPFAIGDHGVHETVVVVKLGTYWAWTWVLKRTCRMRSGWVAFFDNVCWGVTVFDRKGRKGRGW